MTGTFLFFPTSIQCHAFGRGIQQLGQTVEGAFGRPSFFRDKNGVRHEFAQGFIGKFVSDTILVP
jgi:hypothetical protein